MTTYQTTYQMPQASMHGPQHHPNTFESFSVRPLSGALGAEITDIDLKQLDDQQFAEVKTALLDHQVLTFPDQYLNPDQQTAFMSRFGKPMLYSFAAPLAENEYVTELRSDPNDQFNFGGSWHTDSMNFERPPMLTSLNCIVCPKVGGDTSFSNLYMAWDQLSDGFKSLLRPMQAVAATSLGYGSSTQVGKAEFKEKIATPTVMKPTQEDEEFLHPVVRTHPDTGRLALYVCSSYSARFEDMTQAESLPFLEYLWEHAVQPSLTCRVTWREGMLTVWDNRCCMHYAHNDYQGQARVMHRLIIEGDRPA